MRTSSDLNAALSHHGPLGRWYAAPVEADTAQQWLRRYSERRQRRLRQGRSDAVTLRLACLATRFHLRENIDTEFAALERLFRHRHSPRALALLNLLYGQLLASRQQPEASAHLARGFKLANHLLHPQDYYSLLHRHKLLGLVAQAGCNHAENLRELLLSAVVREQLEATQRSRSAPGHDPDELTG